MNDRSTKQPYDWQCRNPECAVDGKRFRFRSDRGRCPKCTGEKYPQVQLLALIHYLIPDPMGEITGSLGARFRIACDATRAHLATATNKEGATGEAAAVTCDGCKKIIVKQRGVLNISGQPFRGNPQATTGNLMSAGAL